MCKKKNYIRTIPINVVGNPVFTDIPIDNNHHIIIGVPINNVESPRQPIPIMISNYILEVNNEPITTITSNYISEVNNQPIIINIFNNSSRDHKSQMYCCYEHCNFYCILLKILNCMIYFCFTLLFVIIILCVLNFTIHLS